MEESSWMVSVVRRRGLQRTSFAVRRQRVSRIARSWRQLRLSAGVHQPRLVSGFHRVNLPVDVGAFTIVSTKQGDLDVSLDGFR